MAPSIADTDFIKANGTEKILAKGAPNFSIEQSNLPKKGPRNPPD